MEVANSPWNLDSHLASLEASISIADHVWTLNLSCMEFHHVYGVHGFLAIISETYNQGVSRLINSDILSGLESTKPHERYGKGSMMVESIWEESPLCSVI